MATRSALPEGYVLGDYRIERILGAGGFGITYLARDAALKRLFAIKEYCPHELSKREGTTVYPFTDVRDDYERGLSDFIKEAQTLARFHHRNIVGVARIFEANNTAYMVLNFEEGSSLKEWIKARETKPSQEEIDAIAGPLLDALELIHADNTLHRDIAPDNIYIRKDGSPVLLDFGSARQALTMRSRSVSAIVKAGYSPQEQYSTRAANQGPWTDIYALSATLFRMLIGETPPEASDRTIDDSYEPIATRKLKGYRPTLLAAIDWGLALRPKDRPQTVAEWRGPLLLGKPIPASSLGLAGSASNARGRSRTTTIAAAALAAVLAAAGIGAYFMRGDDAPVADASPAPTTPATPNAADSAASEAEARAKAELAAREAEEARRAEEARLAEEARKKELADAEAARQKVAADAEAARQAGPGIEFSGLDLSPAAGDGSHLVRAVSSQSVFSGKVQPSDTLLALKHNGGPLDVSDAQKAAGAMRRLAACDALVADVTTSGRPRREQVTLPQDFGRLAGTPKTEVARLGASLSASSQGVRIESLTSDSALGKARLRPGDVIKSFAGVPIDTPQSLDAEAAEAVVAGGYQTLEYVRDCAAGNVVVEFPRVEITVEWAGLTLVGNPDGPAVVKTVAPGSLFDTKLVPGDEITDMTVAGSNTQVENLSYVRDRLQPIVLCGNLQVRYRRGGNPGSIVAASTARQSELDLASLGIKGWLLADDRGFEVGTIDGAIRPGWQPGLRVGDVIERLGTTEGAGLASFDQIAQLAFLGSGGEIIVRRDCQQLAFASPAYVVVSRDEPVDATGLSRANRGALLKALFRLGHYRSPYTSREFVETGQLDFQTRSAIAAFKKSRGAPENEGLRPSDVTFLVSQGGADMPGDREIATLREVIPVDIAENSARYVRRIDLFLKSKGYSGPSQRAELARYQASQGQADSQGYIVDANAALAIFLDTLDVRVQVPGERTFGNWALRVDSQTERCEIYTRPTQVQGLMFDFFLQGSPADTPRIVLGVTKGQRGNAMTMNFGGFDGYAAGDVPTVLTSAGKALQMNRDGSTFFPATSRGSISTDLHKALVAGGWIDVIGRSKHGGGLRLRYSGDGFREAFTQMQTECNVRAIADWLN